MGRRGEAIVKPHVEALNWLVDPQAHRYKPYSHIGGGDGKLWFLGRFHQIVRPDIPLRYHEQPAIGVYSHRTGFVQRGDRI